MASRLGHRKLLLGGCSAALILFGYLLGSRSAGPALGNLRAAPQEEAALGAEAQQPGQSPLPGRVAYAFYVTTPPYLCAALVNTKRLKGPLRADSRADIVVMHSTQLGTPEQGYSSREVKHIMGQLEGLGAVLKPVEPLVQTNKKNEVGVQIWGESLTKLRVFELEEYQRVIFMDADGLAWRNLDHLFLLPHARLAMPRSYWEWGQNPGKFASHIAVLEPRAAAVQPLVDLAKRTGGFDMDALSNIYGTSCIALPNEYGLLSSGFREEDRNNYADRDQRPWDSKRMLQEAYYIHFSGQPWKKPWDVTTADVEPLAPPCPGRCDDRDAWLGLYEAYWQESKACQAPA